MTASTTSFVDPTTIVVLLDHGGHLPVQILEPVKETMMFTSGSLNAGLQSSNYFQSSLMDCERDSVVKGDGLMLKTLPHDI